MANRFRRCSRQAQLFLHTALFFVLLSLAADPTFAAGLILGPLCLENVKEVADEGNATGTADGQWVPITYSYDSETAAPVGRMALFNKSIPLQLGLQSCSQLAKALEPQGIELVASGPINKLSAKGFSFRSNSGPKNKIQINANQLHGSLKKVEKGKKRIDGGVLSLAGDGITITNTTTILTSVDESSGTIQIIAANRRIDNIQFQFIGGATFRSNLKSAGNASFRIELADGQASIWAGTFTAEKITSVEDLGIAIGQMQILTPKLQIALLNLLVKDGKGDITATNLRGTAESVAWSRGKVSFSALKANLKLGTLVGTGRSAAGHFTFRANVALQTTLLSETAVLQRPSQSVLSGTIAADLSKVTGDIVLGQLTWSKCSSTVAAFVIPSDAISTVKMALTGGPAALKMRSEVVVTSLSLAGLKIANPFTFTLEYAEPNATLTFPIKIDIGPTTGLVRFADQDQAGIITGGLRKLFLEALVTLDFANPSLSKAEIAPQQLILKIGAAVAAKPIIAGTAPTFGGVELKATNPVPIRLAQPGSTGRVIIVAQTLIVGEPILRIGDDGALSRASLKLESESECEFVYDLSKSGFHFQKGKLGATDVTFGFLQSGARVDLSGTLVTDPRFTVARIAIDYDAVQEPRIGTALMEHVLVNGSHVDHNRDPAKPKEIVYHATPARPLTIDRIAAAHVELESALVIEVIGIEGIDIALKDAHVELGAGMKLDDGELGLSGSAVRQVKVANLQVTQFDHIRVRARGVFDPGEAVNINGGAKFALDVTVSGIANELSGSGTGTLDALTGSKQTKAKVGFACEHSDGINVPLEYDFAVGGVSLAVDFISGSVQAKAEIGPLALAVHSTSGDECVTEVKHWVVVSKGWTWGICTQLLPPKAWRCRWETPELSFNYRIKFAIRLAVGALVITRPLIYLDDNRLRICNLGIVQTTGLGIAGGYSPQIVTPFGGDGEKIINAFISTAFELPQTLVASSIASGAGWLISGVATPLGNAMCLF